MEKWFDSTVYMQNKLAQMQATDPAYTMTQLVADFAAAGFVGEEGYFNHFMQFGAAEEVAPNAYFNADEYYAAKAHEYYGDKFDGSEFQIAQVKALINNEGMNAWTHYQQFGSSEGVNPSNAFDASDYCAAKAEAMNTAGQKDPDFILRPSGEKRLSNFMLWQAAYSELVEMDVLWPDFTRSDLDAAIEEFNHRSRRFGGL